jgi:tetratricopeptide (TPR) repeat protein
MQWLPCILITLSALTVCLSGLGFNPLTAFIPGVAPYTLPGLLIVASLLVQRRYDVRSETLAAQALGHCQGLQEEGRTASERLDQVANEVTQLSNLVHVLQQTVHEQEALLPGKLLLLQQRYDEAVNVCQQTIAHHPPSQEARWLLGEALAGAKRFADALPHLQAGLLPGNAHRLSLVAQCEQVLGHYAEAEMHLLQLIAVRGEARQEDLMALGVVQSELDPARAVATLSQVLELNPYNSAARYQLIGLMMRTGEYERAIDLATDGLSRNPADISCFVSRAEAHFWRGRVEDEKAILHDLMLAQTKNRKDYNIYRLRGALYQRQANRASSLVERHRALHQALETYEEGLANIPAKFYAHLLAAESRVLLQLERFDDAAQIAQRAVDHHATHVSNHLALAIARLAAGQWQAAVQAAERGIQWAGWGGRVWLTAIVVFAHACAGRNPLALRQKCTTLAAELAAGDRHFTLSESWSVIRDMLQKATGGSAGSGSLLVHDTIALLEQNITPEQYQRTWGDPQALEP